MDWSITYGTSRRFDRRARGRRWRRGFEQSDRRAPGWRDGRRHDDGRDDAGAYAGLEIPANLRIALTDTDAERLRKRKRVKALKAAFRLRQQEELAAAKQSSWQGFQKRQRTS